MAKITVKDTDLTILNINDVEYICITDLKGNIRDYATTNELICLSNMENLNAVFTNEGLPQKERIIKLNQSAIQQMRVLAEVRSRNVLK